MRCAWQKTFTVIDGTCGVYSMTMQNTYAKNEKVKIEQTSIALQVKVLLIDTNSVKSLSYT